MAAVHAIREGDVVLIRARVRAVYPEARLLSVRIATVGSEGGPGFREEIFTADAVAGHDPAPPEDDPSRLPRWSWR